MKLGAAQQTDHRVVMVMVPQPLEMQMEAGLWDLEVTSLIAHIMGVLEEQVAVVEMKTLSCLHPSFPNLTMLTVVL